MTKVAVLSSHNGSGFDALYEASLTKDIPIEITLLISNNTASLALQNAKKYGIKNRLINSKTNLNPEKEIHKLLEQSQCQYIFLSGYMKKIPKSITEDFIVINSHPSLLPKYGGKGMYGNLVHEQVLNNNEATTGVTIHKVNSVYDDGEIILQKKLAIADKETVISLSIKIKELEKIAIVEAFKICLK